MRVLPVLLALVAGPLHMIPARSSEPVEILTARMFLEAQGQTAELEWPVVAGGAGDEAVILMNEALSYENVAGEPLEETMDIYSQVQRGIVGSGFEVNFDGSGILDITITIDFVGAYPSTFEHYFCFDTGTGERLGISDLMKPDRLGALAGLLDERLQENVRTAMSICCSGPDGIDPAIYSSASFREADLERFSIMEGGIEFHYDYGFPHVMLAAEPERDIFLSYEELQPYIDPEGPLGRL